MQTEPNIKIRRTKAVVQHVQNMSLGHIRRIMRIFTNEPSVTPDHFIPRFGMTLGEFCVGYVVRSQQKK